MRRNAENISSFTERNRTEIEETEPCYSTNGFMDGGNGGTAVMVYRMNGRRLRLYLAMPEGNSGEFTTTETGHDRAPAQAATAWGPTCCQRWRALAPVIRPSLKRSSQALSSWKRSF